MYLDNNEAIDCEPANETVKNLEDELSQRLDMINSMAENIKSFIIGPSKEDEIVRGIERDSLTNAIRADLISSNNSIKILEKILKILGLELKLLGLQC